MFWLRQRLILLDRLIFASNLPPSWPFKKLLKLILFLSLKTPTWLRSMLSVLLCMSMSIIETAATHAIIPVNPRTSPLPGVFGERGPKLF